MCGFCGARAENDGLTAVARNRAAVSATASLVRLRVRVRAWGGRFIVASATGRSVIVDRPGDISSAASAVAGRT